jgi:hypothetical protein
MLFEASYASNSLVEGGVEIPAEYRLPEAS